MRRTEDMNKICKFTFADGINKRMIEEQIAAAIISAESIFGEAKVRLSSVGYLVAGNKAAIDASDEVGQHIAQVFTGLVRNKFGEDKFNVERIRK